MFDLISFTLKAASDSTIRRLIRGAAGATPDTDIFASTGHIVANLAIEWKLFHEVNAQYSTASISDGLLAVIPVISVESAADWHSVRLPLSS